jgi:hypothetical protein
MTTITITAYLLHDPPSHHHRHPFAMSVDMIDVVIERSQEPFAEEQSVIGDQDLKECWQICHWVPNCAFRCAPEQSSSDSDDGVPAVDVEGREAPSKRELEIKATPYMDPNHFDAELEILASGSSIKLPLLFSRQRKPVQAGASGGGGGTGEDNEGGGEERCLLPCRVVLNHAPHKTTKHTCSLLTDFLEILNKLRDSDVGSEAIGKYKRVLQVRTCMCVYTYTYTYTYTHIQIHIQIHIQTHTDIYRHIQLAHLPCSSTFVYLLYLFVCFVLTITFIDIV